MKGNMEMDSKILWLDCETTGLNPKIHSIWEFAALIEINGEVLDEFHMLVKPYTDESEEYAVEMGGSRLRQAMDEGLDVNEAVSHLKRFMAKYVDKFDKMDKFVPAGKNIAAFDLQFLRAMFKAAGDGKYGIGSWMFSCWRDVTDAIGRAVGAGMRFKNHKLETVAETLGIEHEAHSALSDIKVTRELYQALSGLK